MNAIQQQRNEILAELSQLQAMRRGSITEQYVASTGPDGQPRRRGPYPIYTCKEAGRTVSRRLHRPELLEACRDHIAKGRRFRALTDQLLHLGEQLSDQILSGTALKKTKKPGSRRASKPKALLRH
jgi:hypothetical protein